MRTTIRDIAERAGVSKTTVSFAFNDPSKISKETYARIMDIASELGYVPDPIARTLTTKRIGAIGLLLPHPIPEALKNPYFSEIIQGMGAVCQERDFSLTLIPPVQGKILEAVRRAAVDGIVTVGVGPYGKVIELIRKRNVPFVTIDGINTDYTVNVGADDENAAFTLMHYVLSAGHRRITIVELRSEAYNSAEERFSHVRDLRMSGFDRALREVGLSLSGHEGVTHLSVESSVEGGRSAAETLLADLGKRPSAVVAMADIVAAGIYACCRERGVRIPEDLSVAGFDDLPLASLLVPGLTTMRQPGFKKGYEAALAVTQLLDGKKPPHRFMEAELVVRGSVAAPMGTGA
jgi:DNA-binding LacI/PurR family transcriptional regulator